MLLLSCPFEILPDGPERKPDAKRLPAMSRALSMLGYDAAALNLDEAEYLQSAQAPLPAHFTVLGQNPETSIVHAGEMPIGIVFFPTSPNPKEPVPADLLDATAKAAASLRGKVKLVVGLSGWGMSDEEGFLNAHPEALDVLLGSGPNAGAAGRPSATGKTLWSRSYIKGKTINRLDILALPGATDFAWKPEKTFKAEVVSLDDLFPADPDIQKLFQ
ncbi:MAG: hypothetical protein AB9872_04800 [Solidesulfovibrio sp.]